MIEQAPYASDPRQTRGRLYGTDDSPTRSPFQRDRDRIVHSSAFRRLQHKTQVFLHHEGHHFRTRLTHTLEVSQIARSIARALGLNEDLAEAIALAHDLGHTPFGHAGERVLNDKMAAWGGFDHNVQALRTVTMIENRYAGHDGLNLTWETLEGILKHNGPLTDGQGNPVGKYAGEGLPPGLEGLPLPGDLLLSTYASLEAQAAAVADDVAYNAHDTDDAVRAGLITLDDMRDLTFAGPIVEEVVELWPDVSGSRRTHEVQRRLITRSIEDLISQSQAKISRLGPATADDVRHAGYVIIDFSPVMMEGIRELKSFLFERVYRSQEVMRPVRQSQEVVARLFDHLMTGSDMPGRWGEAFDAAEGDRERARIVGDFVAGMTDPYALELHERLFDARPDFR